MGAVRPVCTRPRHLLLRHPAAHEAQQQKVDTFLAALKVGDRVVTSGGIFGSITELSDQAVQLQIADKVRIRISRNAIVGYQGQEPVATEGQS